MASYSLEHQLQGRARRTARGRRLFGHHKSDNRRAARDPFFTKLRGQCAHSGVRQARERNVGLRFTFRHRIREFEIKRAVGFEYVYLP